MLGRLTVLFICFLPLVAFLLGNGFSAVRADDDVPNADVQDDEAPGRAPSDVPDVVEGEEEEEATVETDEPDTPVDSGAAVTETEQEEAEAEDKSPKPSPDSGVKILFTSPSTPAELPGGGMVRFLVGFTNNGEKEFVVQSISASFRYPHDYSYYIQNFTEAMFHQPVKPRQQATFEYAFSPSESLHSRPFGLTILLGYKDEDDNVFENTVYNDTVNIVETSEGLDGETFFLYVFLAAIVVLLFVGAQQLVASFGIKRPVKSRPVIEMGTQKNKNSDVDYDWIPKETIQHLNRSPGRSPKQSPNVRRSKRKPRSAGED